VEKKHVQIRQGDPRSAPSGSASLIRQTHQASPHIDRSKPPVRDQEAAGDTKLFQLLAPDSDQQGLPMIAPGHGASVGGGRQEGMGGQRSSSQRPGIRSGPEAGSRGSAGIYFGDEENPNQEQARKSGNSRMCPDATWGTLAARPLRDGDANTSG
jgi:hypothetical protein